MPVKPPTGMPGIRGEVVIVPLGFTVVPPPTIEGPVAPLTPGGSVTSGAVMMSVGVVTRVGAGVTGLTGVTGFTDGFLTAS